MSTVNAVDYYDALLSDAGNVAEAIDVITSGNDVLVFAAQKHLTPPVVGDLILLAGAEASQIEWEQDGGGDSTLEFTIEVYEADTQGAPVDSGITAQPVGRFRS